jgi:hypothetical protein
MERQFRERNKSMGKPHLFDEIARLLASSMPRRQAFRVVAGMLAGGALTVLGAREAHAAGCTCPPAPPHCNDPIAYGVCRVFCNAQYNPHTVHCTTCCSQCLTLC